MCGDCLMTEEFGSILPQPMARKLAMQAAIPGTPKTDRHLGDRSVGSYLLSEIVARKWEVGVSDMRRRQPEWQLDGSCVRTVSAVPGQHGRSIQPWFCWL